MRENPGDAETKPCMIQSFSVSVVRMVVPKISGTGNLTPKVTCQWYLKGGDLWGGDWVMRPLHPRMD